MRKYEWWEKFLAGRILRDLAECDTHYDDLEKEHKELEKKHGEIYDRLQDCYEDKLDCNELAAKLLEDVNYYRGRVRQLTSALAAAIVIPDIKNLVDIDEAVIVKPYEMPEFSEYDMMAADLEYYALPLETWETILPLIQVEVEDALTRYQPQIADCVIPEELAWGLGLFLADGSCGFRNGMGYSGAWWRITNTNTQYLERAKKAFEDYFLEMKFKIVNFQSEAKGTKTNLGERKNSLYHLEVNPRTQGRDKHGRYSHGDRGKFIERFRNDFYIFGEKKIPACLWDKGNRKPKLAFLEGFYAGDGNKGRGSKSMHVKSAWTVAGLIECMINVGWKFKLRQEKGGTVIRVNRLEEHLPFLADYIWENGEVPRSEVAKWLEENFSKKNIGYHLKKLEDQGYIKRLKRRTRKGDSRQIKALKPYPEACDDFALVMNAFMAIAMRKARFDRQSAFMIVWSRTHAYNAFVDTDGDIWLYEPQSDVIGDKLEEGVEPYDSRRIWFPHERASRE